MACNQHMGSPMGTRKHLNYLIYDYNKVSAGLELPFHCLSFFADARPPSFLRPTPPNQSRTPVTQNLEDTLDETLASDVEVDANAPKQKPWTMPYWQVGKIKS